MKEEICNKIRQHFSAMSIYKDPASTGSLFVGRNLPAFVKDFLLKRYLNVQTGEVDKLALTQFLDKVIPSQQGSVKDRLQNGEEVTLLARFTVYIDIIKNERQFAIPDYSIKLREGIIPEYVYSKNSGDFVDGERWGIIKLCLLPDSNGKTSHIQMVDYKPFKPYSSVDVGYLEGCCCMVGIISMSASFCQYYLHSFIIDIVVYRTSSITAATDAGDEVIRVVASYLL